MQLLQENVQVTEGVTSTQSHTHVSILTVLFRTFSTTNNFRGEKPYTCEFCQMDFMTYTALATHTMKHENVLSTESPEGKEDGKNGMPLSIVTVSDSNLVLSLSN